MTKTLAEKVKMLIEAEIRVNGVVFSQLRVYHDGEVFLIRSRGLDANTKEHKYHVVRPERVVMTETL